MRCRRQARSSRPAAQAAPDARRTRAGQACDAGRRTSRRRRTSPPSKARLLQIGFDELHPIESETPRRRGAEPQVTARVKSAPTTTRSARARYRHIWPGSASDLDDPRIAGNGLIDQARERASLGARVKRRAGCRAADNRETARARRNGARRRCAHRSEVAGWESRPAPRSGCRSRGTTSRPRASPAHAGQASSSRKASTIKRSRR